MAVLHGSGVGEYAITSALANGHLSRHGSAAGEIVWRLAQFGTPTAVYASANLLPSAHTADLL